jgi:hypothetical protein
MLDEELGGEAQILATAFVKTLGAGVAIDGVVIREIVIVLNQVGIAPTDEGRFYVGTVGLMANGAFARVAIESGRTEIFVAVGAGGFVGVAVEGFGDKVGSVSAGDDLREMYSVALGLGFAFALGGALGNNFRERAGNGNFVGGGWENRVGFWLRFLLQF